MAVDHLDGPLLILAGPGSGKTRVITRRVARMVEGGVEPRRILAITFTNKAAREMAARIALLIPGSRVWVSTFHRFCASLLRGHGEAVGLRSNFTIYDTVDQRNLLRRVLHDLNVDTLHYQPAAIGARISAAKNDLLTAEQFVDSFNERVGDHFQAVVAKAYPEYQKRLLAANAVDFDDLLLRVVELLHENPELRRTLDDRYRYVLVDEFQDTNLPQYQIVKALSQDDPNLCATGDPDQSIYGWRGARIENILRFEADFPGAKVVRLEDNFRSTKSILRVADTLISRNVRRKQKALVTDNPEGEPVELLQFADERQEAAVIAAEIRRRVEAGERGWSDFAVMYRVNALSRPLEIALLQERIPYQVAAGVSFYERAEIKDVLGYLRLIHNPRDEIAFRRVVNVPRRGIGGKTEAVVAAWAAAQRIDLVEAAARGEGIPGIAKRAAKPLAAFAKLLHDFADLAVGPVTPLLSLVIERTGYTREWINSDHEEDQQRLANVQELLTAAQQYDRARGDEASLEGFLEDVSLTSDVDGVDEGAGQVTLLTLHSAKGLEFPVVYIVAIEQNLIPHERSLRSGDLHEYEEERRLLFVGLTRAQNQLFLTQARMREHRGRTMHSVPSDFLTEMPLQVRDLAGESWAGRGSRRVDNDVSPPDEEFDADLPSQEFEGVEIAPKRTPPGSGSRPLLMTGADLLNGTIRAAELPQAFSVGMTVRHPRYGLGVVTAVGGYGGRRTVTVAFQDDGRSETFVQSKCPLQPVGMR